MESAQLSANGALLNVPFGNNYAPALDSESLYQNQMMQSIGDSNIHGYLDQNSRLRDELETRAFLNQPMQYHQAELDSGPQNYSDYGQTSQDQQSLLLNLRNQASRQADGDELVNMINASLKDHF